MLFLSIYLGKLLLNYLLSVKNWEGTEACNMNKVWSVPLRILLCEGKPGSRSLECHVTRRECTIGKAKRENYSHSQAMS